MKKEKVVVFGSTGTVGAYSALLLSKEGYEVIAVGRRNDDNGFFNSIGATYLSLDITIQYVKIRRLICSSTITHSTD